MYKLDPVLSFAALVRLTELPAGRIRRLPHGDRPDLHQDSVETVPLPVRPSGRTGDTQSCTSRAFCFCVVTAQNQADDVSLAVRACFFEDVLKVIANSVA